MKTKGFSVLLLTGVLALSTACSTAASAADATQAEASNPASGAAVNIAKQAALPEHPEETGMMAKITALTTSEITVLLAEMPEGAPQDGGPEGGPGGDFQPPEMPEGEGAEPPARPDRTDSEGSRPERPQGEAPDRDGRPGRGGGGAMTFAEDAVTYPLASGVTVKKGVGDNEETLTLDDLADDDIVRIALDDNGDVAVIHVMDMDMGGAPPQAPEGAPAEPEAE